MAAALAPLALEIGKDAAMGVAFDAGRKLLSKGVRKIRKLLHFKKGGKVKNPQNAFNLKPRLLEGGGRVTTKRGMSHYQRHNDSVRAILQPGEVVIPVKYYQKNKKKHINLADDVLAYLKKKKVKLPNT